MHKQSLHTLERASNDLSSRKVKTNSSIDVIAGGDDDDDDNNEEIP